MIRTYADEDYLQVRELYEHPEWFGGEFDEARDARERLATMVTSDSESILVYEADGEITGTVSLIVNARVAWLFRFAVRNNDREVTTALHKKAVEILRSRGHTQVLVYTPSGNRSLDTRYDDLGMNKGSEYTCFWQEI